MQNTADQDSVPTLSPPPVPREFRRSDPPKHTELWQVFAAYRIALVNAEDEAKRTRLLLEQVRGALITARSTLTMTVDVDENTDALLLLDATLGLESDWR